MITCAVFAKSPNCASHITSADGCSSEKLRAQRREGTCTVTPQKPRREHYGHDAHPYSKPITASSERLLLTISSFAGVDGMWFSGVYLEPVSCSQDTRAFHDTPRDVIVSATALDSGART
jgi:hypothetical protein